MIRPDIAGWALLLVAIGIAYFVCLKASKEGSQLFKYGGYTIGVIILIVSLILAISDLASRRRRVPPMGPRRATTAPIPQGTRRNITAPTPQPRQAPVLPPKAGE